ncbi:Minichromosome maintenance protein 10 [Ogataea parapolymorpha DL-1]|uniref:Minichromosome maintenance protein 10 n=1 Tax=Ogataea parapolymorpha (strain ATCC 26012 / BCRC 20466 / JCM 22074 / NRRL Y-7560 / DL-1) TaxID=871575 RepID=W1QJU6_OGAPD|nr:Minichromosome maintenance protein 10 [Ogataea parapolymorpha DL-1]ESX02102.1 Minichromosome maintenance protein 10 [Ogataea parapolymorpha DL-1]
MADDDLSDLEDKILDQLHQIRTLKEQKKAQSAVESDEEDPRESTQTPYFRKHRAAEKKILTKISTSKPETDSFAQRLDTFNLQLSHETEKRRKFQEQIRELRVLSFDEELLRQKINNAVDDVDTYSKHRLSKRYYSQDTLEKLLKNIEPLRVHHALAKIHAPNFDPPQYANFAVVGVVAAKSEAKQTANDKTKYMSVQLSNLKQQLTLTLFSKAFKKYYKLRLGDVVAVLNPQIWVQRERTGFALSLKEDYDAILEIGHARDFGLCKSIKKDGSLCHTPIDLSKTQHCDYHTELSFNRTASKRLELTGNSKMFTPTEDGVKQAMYMSTKRKNGREQLDGLLVADASVPKQDVGRLYFSNPDVSRAFFDDSYSNPKLINDLQSAKSRLARVKNEKRLRQKLVALADGDTLKDISLETPESRESRQKATKVAFDPQTMVRIGFNPTQRIFEKRKERGDATARSERVAQLLSTAKTEKSLKRTREETLRRQRIYGKHEAPTMVELSSSDEE